MSGFTPLALGVSVGSGALILAWAATVLLRDNKAAVQLRERIHGAAKSSKRPAAPVRPTLRIADTDEKGLLSRLQHLLGYDPGLPKTYAASIPFVVSVALVVGVVCNWRAGSILGPLPGLLVSVLVAGGVARFFFARARRRYRATLFNQLPDAISLVLRAVRAGLPVGEAIRSLSREMPAPSGDEFARVTGEVAIGVPLDTALWHLFGRTQIREYAFFAVTLGLQGQTGGNLTETLENLTTMVRRRVAMVAKARALSAEARTTASILAGMPFLTGGAIAVVNPQYLSPLFNDSRGPYFLTAFVVLLAIGLFTIRWLIQRSTRD